ncbi:MAG: hypothetical protein KDC54_04300 [Lewinella sp.]|nr:hypothetical protein [Lewinella sp.]
MSLQASAEISLYPLTTDYTHAVLDFIQRLKTHEGLRIVTNDLSTQVTGDYDLLMEALNQEMRETFHRGRISSFVIKILNTSIEPGRQLTV